MKNSNLQFWKEKLPSKAKTFNCVSQLDEYIGEMIGDKKEVNIADLGAGVISTTGQTWPGVKVNLYPSDIMKEEFDEFYQDWGIKRLVPMEKQDMEHLTYPNGFFDIVHCSNALDHCHNPRLAILEMVRVCKVGGWVYLRHTPNEGERHNYTWQHQWNIEMVGDDCKFWNKKDSFMMSSCITGFKHVREVKRIHYSNSIISTLHKTI